MVEVSRHFIEINNFKNNPEPIHHEFMASKFISPLKDALKEWDNSSQPNDQYYEDLAWGALIGLAFAFAGLVGGCNPPVAAVTTGWACYLAVANYIRASITVGLECGDE